MKNTSARLPRLSELYLTLLGTEEALVLTTPVRLFQRLALRAERRAYKRYTIVSNVNSHSRGLRYQAKHLLANWWLKHYGLVEAAHPTHPPSHVSTAHDAMHAGSHRGVKCSNWKRFIVISCRRSHVRVFCIHK